MVEEVEEFFYVYGWAEKNRLGFLFREDGLPAIVASALDIIELEVTRRDNYLRQQRQGKSD
jgi:hypothetical protein